MKCVGFHKINMKGIIEGASTCLRNGAYTSASVMSFVFKDSYKGGVEWYPNGQYVALNRSKGDKEGSIPVPVALPSASPYYITGFNRSIPEPIRNESTLNLALSRLDNENLESPIQTESMVMRLDEIVASSRMRSALHICPVNENSTAIDKSIQQVVS